MKVLAIHRPFCSCLVSARLVFLKQRAVCLLAGTLGAAVALALKMSGLFSMVEKKKVAMSIKQVETMQRRESEIGLFN